MREYFLNTINILGNALKTIDLDIFEKLKSNCNDIINNNGKIVVTGLGKNVPICEKFVGTMISLGMPAYFLHTNSAVHGDMGIVKDRDLVIILTKSASTSESVYLYNLLKERGASLWLLTFSDEGILSKKMKNKIVIDLEHEGDMWDIVPNNSTTINLIVLQTLAMQIAKLRNIQLDEFKKNHPGGHIGDVLKDV